MASEETTLTAARDSVMDALVAVYGARIDYAAARAADDSTEDDRMWAAHVVNEAEAMFQRALDAYGRAARAEGVREERARLQNVVHDAIHEAIYEMGECERVKGLVAEAMAAAPEAEHG